MSNDTNLEPAVESPVGGAPAPADVGLDLHDDLRTWGDERLVAATREGDEAAWREIERRHGEVIGEVVGAQGFWRRSKVVRARFDQVAKEIGESAGPDDVVGGSGLFAVRAVRPRVIAAMTGGVYGPAPEVGLDVASARLTELDRHEEQALAEAFGTLPTAWQTVLWHHIVEALPVDETAMFLGRHEHEIEPSAATAMNGLFHAYLRVLPRHAPIESRCAAVVPLLDGHYRETLGAADQRLVNEHLSGTSDAPPCAACRRRLMTAFDLRSELAPAVVPGVTGLDVGQYQELVAAAGPATTAVAVDRRRPFLLEAAVVALVAAAGFLLVARPFGADDGTRADPVGSPAETADAALDDGASAQGADPDVEALDDGSAATGGAVDGGPDAGAEESIATLPPLRPLPTGPRHVVELDFDDADADASDAGAVAGVMAPSAGFTVQLDAPAPVIAGGTGTIDVTVTNSGDSRQDAGFLVRLPGGVRVEAAGPLTGMAADDATGCSVPEQGGFTRCAVGLDPGATDVVTLRFGLESRVVGQLVVAPTVGDELSVGIDVVEGLAANIVEHGELMMIGNTVITCDAAADGCPAARNLVGADVNRFDFPLAYVDVDDDRATVNSSTAQLELGAADVSRALLFWSGDVGVGQASDAETLQFLVPGDDPIEVTAERFVRGDFDASEYLAVADVSLLVGAAGSGDYGVAGLTTSVGQGAYGGWSLVIITDDPTQPRRQFLITRPFSWVAPDYDVNRSLVVSPGESLAATIDVLGFEGEPGFGGERITLGGEVIGGATGFDSSIDGPRTPEFDNNFGMDIDRYDVEFDTDDGGIELIARSTDDGVRLAVVALTVDIE